MTQKRWNSLAIAATAALSLMLAGCGTNQYQVDPYGNYNDPYASDPYGSGSDYGSDYGSGGSYSGGGSYGGGYGSGGSYTGSTGTGAPVYTGGELTAKVLGTKKEGMIFFKKLVATVQIKNATAGVLTGEITVHFTKKGKVVDTQTEFVSDLSPGQSHTFDKKSRKTADNVEVSVVTTTPSHSSGSYGNNTGYGSGTGYNSGTSGSDPYGGGGTYNGY